MDNFLKVFIAQFTVSQLILIDLFFFFFEVQTAMYTYRLNREVIAPQFVTMHFVSRKLHVLGGRGGGPGLAFTVLKGSVYPSS